MKHFKCLLAGLSWILVFLIALICINQPQQQVMTPMRANNRSRWKRYSQLHHHQGKNKVKTNQFFSIFNLIVFIFLKQRTRTIITEHGHHHQQQSSQHLFNGIKLPSDATGVRNSTEEIITRLQHLQMEDIITTTTTMGPITRNWHSLFLYHWLFTWLCSFY